MTPQEEQFLQASLKGDVTAIKRYLSTEYQVEHLYEYPLAIKFESFVVSPLVEICEVLLNNGILDINAYLISEEIDERSRSTTKTTALNSAITQGNLPKVQWLLGKGADVNKPNHCEWWNAQGHFENNKTPLALAKEKGYNEIADLLKSAGAKE